MDPEDPTTELLPPTAAHPDGRVRVLLHPTDASTLGLMLLQQAADVAAAAADEPDDDDGGADWYAAFGASLRLTAAGDELALLA